MPSFVCKLLRSSPGRGRPVMGRAAARPAPVRDPVSAPSGHRWDCLELNDRPADPHRLRTVRELVVHRPAALTLEVLAAAPALLAVVLPEHCQLPAEVSAELDRRRIATVWRPGQQRMSVRSPAARPTVTTCVARRGISS
jgi:hypothetical protein